MRSSLAIVVAIFLLVCRCHFRRFLIALWQSEEAAHVRMRPGVRWTVEPSQVYPRDTDAAAACPHFVAPSPALDSLRRLSPMAWLRPWSGSASTQLPIAHRPSICISGNGHRVGTQPTWLARLELISNARLLSDPLFRWIYRHEGWAATLLQPQLQLQHQLHLHIQSHSHSNPIFSSVFVEFFMPLGRSVAGICCWGGFIFRYLSFKLFHAFG